jgi:peroxiredoxin
VLESGAPTGRWISWYGNGGMRFCCTLNGGVASGVFDARDEAGSVVAQGILVEGKFADGSVAVENGVKRPIAAGPMPAAEGAAPEWATAEALAALAPEVAVATMERELASKVGDDARVAKVAAASSPAPEKIVAEIVDENERIPAPVQPDLTVVQQKELEGYVQNYLDGPSEARPSIRKYAPAPSSTGQLPAGKGRRPEMEGKPLPIKVLKGVDGGEVNLDQFIGKKRVLLVVLRGFLGEVCVYCVAQTEALARCQDELLALNMEVLVLYPGAKENEESFEKAYEMTFGKGVPPYRVFYDPDLQVVEKLGVAGDLAFPTTIIIDEKGIVQYAYTGEHRADRPAAKELIRVIKGLKQ